MIRALYKGREGEAGAPYTGVQGCRSVADPEFPRGGGFPVNRMMHRHVEGHVVVT